MTVIRSYPTPKGGRVKMAIREDTIDEPVINSTAMHDEYDTRDFDLQPGDLFLDVGAYVGSVGCAVAADFPLARVVMVEAVPENAAVIRQSVVENGWFDGRVTVYNAAATSERGASSVFYGAPSDASEFMQTNRFVGGLLGLRDQADRTADVPNISLSDIVADYGPVAVLKIDCEGCEYAFLDDPVIDQVAYIIGEHHRSFERLLPLLEPTHEVTLVSTNPDASDFGIFTAHRKADWLMRTVKP